MHYFLVKGEFVDGGTDTEFKEDGYKFLLIARTSGNKREGLTYKLQIGGIDIDECIDE